MLEHRSELRGPARNFLAPPSHHTGHGVSADAFWRRAGHGAIIRSHVQVVRTAIVRDPQGGMEESLAWRVSQYACCSCTISQTRGVRLAACSLISAHGRQRVLGVHGVRDAALWMWDAVQLCRRPRAVVQEHREGPTLCNLDCSLVGMARYSPSIRAAERSTKQKQRRPAFSRSRSRAIPKRKLFTAADIQR